MAECTWLKPSVTVAFLEELLMLLVLILILVLILGEIVDVKCVDREAIFTVDKNFAEPHFVSVTPSVIGFNPCLQNISKRT